MDTITPEMQEQLEATRYLIARDVTELGRTSLETMLPERLQRLVETCIAFATQPEELKKRAFPH